MALLRNLRCSAIEGSSEDGSMKAADETQGVMKVFVGANHDSTLGFTMIGADRDTDVDAGGVAIPEASWRRHCAPDNGRGLGHAAWERAASLR
jgi:hypothetical protein